MIIQENQTGKKNWGGFDLVILKIKPNPLWKNWSLHNSDLDH